MQKLDIPIIIGTTRPGRRSELVAKYIEGIAKKDDRIKTKLVDPKDFDMPYDGKSDEVRDEKYTKITKEADGFFIVVPEYNHGYPGTLKRFLDSELKNYAHKPVAFAGVSSGSWGGVRAIENLVPIVRELGLVATFTDVHFPKVNTLFDDSGNIKDDSYEKRVERSLEELIFMAQTLKYGRENIKNQDH